MNDLVTLHDGQLVTTTLAIAEGTKNAHASVIKLVRTYLSDLEEFGLVGFEIQPRPEGQHGGGDTEFAILNEQQSTLLLTYMRNSDIVRAFKKRLVRRFYEMAQELRQQAATRPQLPDFTNPAEAARAWASEYEQKQIALEKLEAAQPAIEFHERVADADSLHSIDEVAKVLRAPPRKFREALKYEFRLFRQDKLPKQEFIDRGYVRVVEQILPHTGKPYPQMFFTGKGLQWIQRRVDHAFPLGKI